MTLNEFLEQPFKYDGEGDTVYVKDVWGELSRKAKRKIELLLKKGKKVEPSDIFDFDDEEE